MKCAPWSDLNILLKVRMVGVDSPLVLPVLGDRGFQHLILGILERRTCQQQSQTEPEMSGLPSRHLKKTREQMEG